MESVYIGVVGGETVPYNSMLSIYGIARREADTPPLYIAATKGYEARQSHINNFIASKHDWVLLLDHDMTFPQDTLPRLLSHGKPFVSGLYMRRRVPVLPIWFENAAPGVMPNRWFTRKIEENALYEIGASGWGCMLIHRSVIEETRKILKNEREVAEDDMDIYPYDLARVMKAISTLQTMNDKVEIEHRQAVDILSNEIRPNRALNDFVGSDVRFPFYAKLAGFQLYGDSGVQCGHVLNYELSCSDWTGQSETYFGDITKSIDEVYAKEQARQAEALRRLA